MSKSIKLIICVKGRDEEVVSEAAIILMHGTQVKSCVMLGEDYDESDDELGSKIILEESDSRFISEDVPIEVKTISTNDVFIEEIFNAMCTVIDDTDPSDIDYIIYNDKLDINKPFLVQDFESNLLDYISEKDDDLTPVSFSYIFTDNQYISSLLDKYKVTDHMFTATSVLSGAIWTSLIYDIMNGRSV
jgi:hypothetical protein